MMATRRTAVLAATTLLAGWSIGAGTALGANAEIRVETSPPAVAGELRFEGLPAGAVSLAEDGTGLLSAEVGAGSHVSSLAWMDPALVDAGYRLVEITCDDMASARSSHGDSMQGTATFEVEEGETVACIFRLAIASACTCPREGTWRVDNHPGSMACTGAMSMTMPLAPSKSRGKLSVNDGCTRIVAAGMSEDEADLDMALQPDCSWLGTVGGSQDGIPMTITFRWNVESEERITGNLESTVSQQGMTCRMSRTYQLDFAD
ncbi:hypothetical protein [Thioalkalivibrio sp. XN279]|uniref:hypothetical protein n=1 Tax=Thioalkalivibrio sp. XN279 TaxID=2714953 RepID=UPI00140DC3BF|nr:hypothetical protein [Thioalkalivibrio sp. XN279]NHA13959.1 hypothetical protein [Thioalkalivibrio sp. XN279]